MLYDFDGPVDRRHTDSLKWDVGSSELPMWVADMDFRTVPQITDALIKRASTGVFGYSVMPDAWYGSVQKWWRERHGFEIEKEWLLFCTGVIPAISCTVKRLTDIGDNVAVQTPVYNHFFTSIENNGRHVIENRLKYEDGHYSVDFEDLEKKLEDPRTTLMLLCNPQNPSGNIWSREDLVRINELAMRNHVRVLSDEIHCDITDPDYDYVPFASASGECALNSVTCIAPSKTFNIAGLQTSAMIVPDRTTRDIIERGLWSYAVAEPNSFAEDAAVAAYTYGGQWLDELRGYIRDNKKMVSDYLVNELPQISAVESHATYLYWLDCSKITHDSKQFCEILRKDTGLFLSDGAQYRGNGNSFVRMNLACQKSAVRDGLERLKKGVLKYDDSRSEQGV